MRLFDLHDLAAVRAKVSVSKADLALAKLAGKENVIKMYGNNLIGQQEKLYILLAGAGN